MSAKMSGSTHDKLKSVVDPIHKEIGELTIELERINSQRAILSAMAISEIEDIGLSKDAVGKMAAACW